MLKEKTTRRAFLGAAASGALFTIVPRHVLGGEGNTPPSEKLNIAGIGIGGMGQHNLGAVAGSENIVALCDVDHAYAAGVFQKYPDAAVFSDYREMLDKRKDIDAVIIATPDHTHAVIAQAAMKTGRHVYCQKPLTHDIYESRVLARTAVDTGVTTQMGIQGHSGEGTRLVREWIQAGAVGEVTEVDAWCLIGYYPWGHAYYSSKWGGSRPTDTPPVPATMDWDLWIGPALMRPYHPAYHPVVWRCWQDFGSSMMCDRGTHTFDPIIWALELGPPTSVEASALGENDETHCLAAVVTYRFPARKNRPPVKLTWYEGLRAPRPAELEYGRVMGETEGGAVFHGAKGKMMCGIYGNSPRLIPESKMDDFQRPEKTIPRIPDSHEMDWVRACKEGRQAGAPFDYGAMVTEICFLGNIAKRAKGPIEWDSANMKVTNDPEADKLVRRPYREGWTL
ncbi:MAG TPA: Gfo/Idh/MocA family oxidoreductase [Candidatus Brocadiia bacterium]|nr:Gfo/Idh/MocA family oxidoreductase [Candidatus Brocadiia bacterium]